MEQDPFRRNILKTFDYLHSHPELSWEEKNTTDYIRMHLEKAGCIVRTFSDCTGVIGDFGNFNGDHPKIAFRADMDALWQEVNGISQPNHSCGHDAHMTIMLGVLWKLAENPELKDKIAVRFIFQPAEEVGSGALAMVERGVIETIDYLFGVHLRPKAETPNGFATPAILHGATWTVEFDILGEDAHGARPHLTKNAIDIGTHIVTALYTIHLDPTVPYSVKVTKFQAGGFSTNIIPGQASLAIDLRAQTNELMEVLRVKVYGTLQAAEQLFDTEIAITNDYGIVAAKVHPDAEKIAHKAIAKTLGVKKTNPPLLTPGGDDFHFYTIKKPTIKATMIGLGCDLEPGLHHPDMTFDKEAIFNGIDIFTEITRTIYDI
ncbi:M20 peptidase aminoacylase family protein [Pseudogracilibacillus auburnensis]|uniref:M20 peptidase aminoacylase family protein n=1 Tax=Pseudogracilibacillus auburnensis TaxID=1494959 RepID=UPI001A959E71|nr:M20 peptidase aminoacylase family protein [Pseudogracilibacillus auburnensis]MBO1003947.1 M20 peptidase aminoacylase family protein [Pseudogracilibacillus auburnensis]